MSALRFSWALIEQRKRNKPPVRNRLGSLAAIGLVLARCARCSVVLGAVQCCALCSAGGGRGGGGCTILRPVQRCGQCGTPFRLRPAAGAAIAVGPPQGALRASAFGPPFCPLAGFAGRPICCWSPRGTWCTPRGAKRYQSKSFARVACLAMGSEMR